MMLTNIDGTKVFLDQESCSISEISKTINPVIKRVNLLIKHFSSNLFTLLSY